MLTVKISNIFSTSDHAAARYHFSKTEQISEKHLAE
jgi:hypothetical protein